MSDTLSRVFHAEAWKASHVGTGFYPDSRKSAMFGLREVDENVREMYLASEWRWEVGGCGSKGEKGETNERVRRRKS